MFIEILEAISGSKDKERKKIFDSGMEAGLYEGIQIGLKRHFESTSELSDEENELLIKFLIRHNFVLCIDENRGFRVMKNSRLNPQPEQKVCMVDPDYKDGKFFNTVCVSLAKSELANFSFKLEKSQYGL